MLRDLNEIGIQCRKKYLNNFKNIEIRLSDSFKTTFEDHISEKQNTIRYLDNTAEVTSNSSGNRIFLPNQWFIIATYMTEYARELLKYKEVLLNIHYLISEFITFREFMDEIKESKKGVISQRLNQIILETSIIELREKELLIRFLSDYEWWFGKKTIDRKDFFVSPILGLIDVVNVASEYIADITYFYAINDDLYQEALAMIDYVENIDNQIFGGKNLIIYGAPGTGKSRYVENSFTNLTRVVFHSEYSYYDFVGCYKPTPLYKGVEERIVDIAGNEFSLGIPLIDYRFVPGPFIEVLIKAIMNKENMYTLLIEELNRANSAAVFGDVFQLLDRDINGRSEYKVHPNVDLKKYLDSLPIVREYLKEGLFIPSNLNIVATMNSADQGVYTIDSAFKRRWQYKHIPLIEDGFVNENYVIYYSNCEFKWKSFLKVLNAKLKEFRIDEDRLIGPYFVNQNELKNMNLFTSKIFVYLWDDLLRHKRDAFFQDGIRTYTDLIIEFKAGKDVLKIVEKLKEIESQNNNVVQEETLEINIDESI